jgi:hypothetical protein
MNDGIEGGGLIIDYTARNETAVRRVVFGFNELGMWVEWEGAPAEPTQA